MGDIIVRPARPGDRAAWEPLWQGYLTFYKASLAAEVTDTTWQRFLDPAEPMFVRGAFENGKLLGIVQCVLHRTSWSPKPICYLQDLFTVPEARGKGVGKALVGVMELLARQRGAEMLTVDASEVACEFFVHLGYEKQARNTVMRAGEWLANTTMTKNLPPAPKANA